MLHHHVRRDEIERVVRNRNVVRQAMQALFEQRMVVDGRPYPTRSD